MSVNAEPNDAELVGRMASGDREAFAELFRRHQATVFRFSRQMLGSREAAEDVTQDVFIALARNVRRFDSTMGSLTTYLYGIARNLILQRHKRSRWHHVNIDSLDDVGAPATTFDPADALTRDQMQRRLRLSILRLPVHYREVIVLCELNGLSYEDAAKVAGCPVGTIRSRLSRARDMLIARCRALLVPEREEGRGMREEVRRKWLLATKNNC
jgi:RNA polymerase sigma-70 factor, ECF subfamily